MKTLIKSFIIFFILFYAATFGWSKIGGHEEAVKYRITKITRGNITEVVTANGTLNPVQVITVGTQVSGQIQKIYVNLNDQVKQGQLLAEVDPSLPEAELKQIQASAETARVTYEQAARDLERARMLVEKDFIAKVELEQAQQAYLSARNSYDAVKSQVERAKVNLGYTKIYAPIDGIVISQEVTSGQTVQASYQTPNLFKIAGDLREMLIDVSFPESDISKIKKGLRVTFTVDAFPDKTFKGIVDVVNLNPSNDQGVVTYKVTVKVENKDKLLLPGMTAYVNVTLSEIKNVLRVPNAALRFTPPPAETSGFKQLFQPSLRTGMRIRRDQPRDVGPGKGIIHLYKNGNLQPVEVKLGKSDESFVAVSSPNIAENDMVVTGVATPSGR